MVTYAKQNLTTLLDVIKECRHYGDPETKLYISANEVICFCLCVLVSQQDSSKVVDEFCV